MGAIRRDGQAREVDGSKETDDRKRIKEVEGKGTKKEKRDKIIKGNGRQEDKIKEGKRKWKKWRGHYVVPRLKM
jgi:hypothetical protein